jgi:hypothetical protein
MIRAHQILEQWEGEGISHDIADEDVAHRMVRDVCELIRAAVKFDCHAIGAEPVSSKTLYAAGREILETRPGSLPSDVCYYEFTCESQLPAPLTFPMAALCHRIGAKVRIYELTKNERNGWYLCGCYVQTADNGRLMTAYGSWLKPDAIHASKITAASAATHVAVALALIESRAVDTATEAAPAKLNKNREAKGQIPLFSHTVVTIRPRAARGPDHGGSHASPRLHERRGHSRTLKSGKVVPVRKCMVGDKMLGVVRHTYKVEPPDKPS